MVSSSATTRARPRMAYPAAKGSSCVQLLDGREPMADRAQVGCKALYKRAACLCMTSACSRKNTTPREADGGQLSSGTFAFALIHAAFTISGAWQPLHAEEGKNGIQGQAQIQGQSHKP